MNAGSTVGGGLAFPAVPAAPQKKGLKLFGKFTVPGSFIAYAFLAGLSGASLLALYGVMLTFVLKTVPTKEEEAAQPVIMKQLKQAMVGLVVGVIVPIFIVVLIVGAGTKGLLRAELYLFLFTGLMALTVLSTALVYTQDHRVEETPMLKRGVEGALIGSSLATVALALAGGIEFMRKRKQAAANAGAAFAQLKSGNLAGAGSFFIKGKTQQKIGQNAKTVLGDAQAAKTIKQTHAAKHAAHQAAKQAAKAAKAAQAAPAYTPQPGPGQVKTAQNKAVA